MQFCYYSRSDLLKNKQRNRQETTADYLGRTVAYNTRRSGWFGLGYKKNEKVLETAAIKVLFITIFR